MAGAWPSHAITGQVLPLYPCGTWAHFPQSRPCSRHKGPGHSGEGFSVSKKHRQTDNLGKLLNFLSLSFLICQTEVLVCISQSYQSQR